MPKICVQSPEVVSEGEIRIHAVVNVTTKAKLDEITVQGNCECADVPPPVIDVVCLVDGSDSYNNKVSIGGKIEEGDAFEETNRFIGSELVPGLAQALGGRSTFTLVQFSGVKQLEKTYTPGADGETGTSGLKHYNIEQAPTFLSEGMSTGQFNFADKVEGLDGNGQLFLALQDMNMDGFLSRLTGATRGKVDMKKDQKRIRILIVFSDEEWDVKHLANAFGSGKTDGATVCAKNAENYETFAVIVRPNRDADQNEDFIKGNLCNGLSQNYKKVYTDKFDVECKSAIQSIVDDLKRRR
jgi:hypothetical protein